VHGLQEQLLRQGIQRTLKYHFQNDSEQKKPKVAVPAYLAGRIDEGGIEYSTEQHGRSVCVRRLDECAIEGLIGR